MKSKALKSKKKIAKKIAVVKSVAAKAIKHKTSAPRKKAAVRKNPVAVKSKSKVAVKPKAVAKVKASVKSKPVVKKSKKSVAKVAVKKSLKSVVKTPVSRTPVSKTSKSPAKILRPKSFEPAGGGPEERTHGFPENVPELPENYLRDRLVLMTQEPDYLFSYWEITPDQLTRKESEKRKEEEYHEALRLNWPPRSLFDQGFLILPVSLSARRWYLQVPFPGLSYQVEIGWLSDKGEFISILGSNESETPESWSETQRRLRNAGEILSRAASVSTPSGSSEQMRVEEVLLASLNWKPGSASSSTRR